MNIPVKYSLIFILVGLISNAHAQQSIFHINFEKNDSVVIKKYVRKYRSEELKFLFKKKHSLKSSLFIYNKKSHKKVQISPRGYKKIQFSSPWQAYWNYHIAKESNKPQIFIYEFDKEENCYYKYQVTIEFPPPPPDPGSIE